MNIFLDDRLVKHALRPFTYTRHVADIRVGILTIREKWERITGLPVITEEKEKNVDSVTIDAAIVPGSAAASAIIDSAKNNSPLPRDLKMLQYPWQIFQFNDAAIREDYQLLTAGRKSAPLSATNSLIGEDIFIEEGVSIEFAVLNATAGPIYIGKNAQVMEGSLVRGPFAMGENAVLKMGSRIYGATSIGPHCVAGGEIKNSVLFAHSNKAHDGYLGDSVIGEWCNLGAGTSNSNVKNTGGMVKYIIDDKMNSIVAGNKAGLLMGDYSRAAINTSFNTGTIVGVCCNVFGDAPAKFINNFSWGNERYIFEKAMADISNWKKMKAAGMNDAEIEMLYNIYQNNQ